MGESEVHRHLHVVTPGSSSLQVPPSAEVASAAPVSEAVVLSAPELLDPLVEDEPLEDEPLLVDASPPLEELDELEDELAPGHVLPEQGWHVLVAVSQKCLPSAGHWALVVHVSLVASSRGGTQPV